MTVKMCVPYLRLRVEHVYLWPPGEPTLGDDAVESRDQNMVIEGGRTSVEAHLQGVVIVRVDTEVGQETVYHQVHVLLQVGNTSTKRLLNLQRGCGRLKKNNEEYRP